MQPARRKGSNRKKEVKSENQAKISKFLTKAIENTTNLSNDASEEPKTPPPSQQPVPVLVDTRSPAQIDVDQPLREVIVIDSSPARPPKSRPSPTPSGSNETSSKQPSKRMATTTLADASKAVHPFFAPRTKKAIVSPTEVSPSNPTRIIHSQTSSAPWPNDENIHCGHVDSHLYQSKEAITRHNSRSATRAARVSSKSRQRGDFGTFDGLTEQPLKRVPLEMYTDRDMALCHIPENHLTHPAIYRLVGKSPLKLPQHQLWNDKFAPRKVADVLHNTDKVEYLCSWMKALEVQVEGEGPSQGSKLPQVVIQRAVDKKRKRRRPSEDSDDIEDFVVDDDDDEPSWSEDGNESETNDLLSIAGDLPTTATTASSTLSSREPSPFPTLQLTTLGTRSRPSARKIINSPPISPSPSSVIEGRPKKAPPNIQTLPSLTERLANTLILHGPNGCGKTAAIYACAEELQWKVFEFYPGLGKRSGAGFMLELGGTGENHRVGGLVTQESQKMDARFSQSLGFLASPSKKSRRPATRMGNHPSAQPVDVHQSLILVEEADIMFQSDVNFWPTLVSFIRSSRRPVIITCNDLGLIPIEDLPLQAILEFQECSNELAVSYLQAIGIHEGHYIKRETAYNYYTHDAMYHPLDADIPDQPMHPLPSQGRLVIPDLKRSINALQFFLTTDNTTSVPYETNIAAFGNWSDRPAVMPEIVNGTEDGLFRKPAPQEDLETLIHLSELADSISFGDAFIDRRLKDSLREGSIDRYRPSSDDTQGYTLLCKVEEPEEAVFTSALRPREDDMALWVAYHARLRLEQRGHGQIARRYLGSPLALTTSPKGSKGPPTPASSFNSTELAIRRAKYQKRIVYALDELMTAKSSLLPSPGCILDYVPWMREMARGMSAEWRGMSLEGSRVLITETLVSP